MSMSFADRRNYFPRGLLQPKDGFRFSVDALLLSCFAADRKPVRVLDLGTGCGVVGLGLLLRLPQAHFSVLGVDRDPAMIGAARVNAEALGFQDRFSTVSGDVASIRLVEGFMPGQHDLVLCNPPYRLPGHGRMPQGQGARSARFETTAVFDDFLAAAVLALKTRGRLVMVHLPEHLHRIIRALGSRAMEPKRLRFVHGNSHNQASLVLIEARKAARLGLEVEPPLILHQTGESGTMLTQEALSLCPFLSANARRWRKTDDGRRSV